MSLPLQHRSDFRRLGPLPGIAGQPLESETPLFAADRDFAWHHGGTITRAFVESLPADPRVHVVIDSSLVWMAPGLAHGFELGPGTHQARPRSPLRFLHEPFPGVATGVRGASNRNLNVLHRLCILGLDCTPEVAVGEFVLATHAEAEAFWLPVGHMDDRDEKIERCMTKGTVARAVMPLDTVVEFGWGTLMRGRCATTTGFQLILRASIGDPRPVVNGRRNLSII